MFKLTIYENGYIFETEKGKINYGNIPSDISEATEFNGQEAYKQFWLLRFNKQDEKVQNILKAVYPNYLERLETEQLKTPDKLWNIAINKLVKLETKFMKECTRCGGTGHYSYNQQIGTKCIKCNGLKYTLPKITKKWLEDVTEYFQK